jgi:hypothetical protein
MRWVVFSLGAALVAGAAGCRNPCDRVESELRARENDVRELKDELDRRQFYQHALEQELRAARGEPGPDGKIHPPSEPYPVRTLALGRQTAARPSDTCMGDDGLDVLVEPRDCEGQAIKAPGELFIEVQEVTKQGLKAPLSSWEFGADELRCKWRAGLLSTGYSLTLPWRVWPSTEKLRVIARFRMTDGRIFEADKDITVRLGPAELRKQAATPEVLPITPTPVPSKELLPKPKNSPTSIDGPSLDGLGQTANKKPIGVGVSISPATIDRPVAFDPEG